MKQLLFIIFLCITHTIMAQTGIGTTSPAVKLHVKSNGPIFRLEGSDHAYMEWYPQGSSTRYGYMGYPSASSTQLTLMNQSSTGLMAFGTNGTNKMFLTLDVKFGNLDYVTENGLSQRMPWYSNTSGGGYGLITTDDGSGNWWGTLIAAGACNCFVPTPWIQDAGGGTANTDPGIIWYWVR